VGIEQWPETINKTWRRKPLVKFWLLTQPQNQVQKLALLEDYFEEEEEEQQQPASAEVAITNTSQ
jgi:hypothetical protein